MDFSIRDGEHVREWRTASTTLRRMAVACHAASAAAARLARFVLVLGAAMAVASCDDIHLTTRNLEIAPNPARAGEAVVASLLVEVLPVQRYEVTVFIDGEEHLSFTEDEVPTPPLLIELGNATALIQTYGAGRHTVYVEVRTKDRSSRTADRAFELLNSAG